MISAGKSFYLKVDIQDEATAFEILSTVSRLGTAADRSEARDLLIRTLERRNAIPEALQGVLASLVRDHGLFPYMDADPNIALSIADQIAYEIHRPLNFPDDRVVFHAEQGEVYRRLLNEENVVLSAPTSFGKSLVVDAVLAGRDFSNAVVIVPTIALIDETRRRLARLAGKYKIITHPSQSLGQRNLFVLTQERLPAAAEMPPIDFFVIDEFYKLDTEGSDDRSDQLNIVFRQLFKTGAQFYLLGPNISSLAAGVTDALRATFFHTEFKTVVTDVEYVRVPAADLQEHFTGLVNDLDGQTLVYCRSPRRTRDVAEWIISSMGEPDPDAVDPLLADAADWLAQNFHPDWLVARALRHGIGIHHGRLPRAIAHHFVRLFNAGKIRILLATSTLIEGVNTTAQNVIVLDNTIGNKKYDFFTFSNILGRSGRMFKHYVGRVIVYNDPPGTELTEVDVPVLTQSDHASESVLIQLPWDEMTPSSRERMAGVFEQDVLSIDTLRSNRGVRPEYQLDVARQLAASPSYWAEQLVWPNGLPTAAQVRQTATLLFALAGSTRSGGVFRADVLGARINSMRYHEGALSPMIESQLRYSDTPDDAVEDVLDFMRQWAQFHVPRALAALERIATEVLPGAGPFRFALFASQVEALFQNQYVTVLEEYGLPMALTSRLANRLQLRNAADLDEVLGRVRQLPSLPGLSAFEQDMLLDVQAGL